MMKYKVDLTYVCSICNGWAFSYLLLRAWSHFGKAFFVHHAHQHQWNEFSTMEVCFSDLTEQGCL